jgi:hypothetical protein
LRKGDDDDGDDDGDDNLTLLGVTVIQSKNRYDYLLIQICTSADSTA